MAGDAPLPVTLGSNKTYGEADLVCLALTEQLARGPGGIRICEHFQIKS